MKKKLTTKQLLASININISQYLALFSYHPDLSEQYTKKGPGRKHKQGVQKYVSRQQEYSMYRRHMVTKEPMW